ncbi:KH domain-containing protein [Hippea alviniae]|uniref:KH domain-containing protein n=1 Tax=Hippea alviniae TaxID=1279027 RepID=UPI0003B43154|nr:KH domain-containing protein [Hippea alviniae]
MKELISCIVKSLVDNQDAVSIKEIAGEKTTVVELSVDKNDLGKIIGKEGKTIKAIRTILNAASKKAGKKAVLEIIE